MGLCLAGALLGLVLIGSPGCRPRPKSDQAKRDEIEALYRQYKKSFPDTPELTVQELLAARKAEKVVIVDVREPAEREVSMIPGAIPVEQFERDLAQHRRHRIVTYCTVGYRSGLYASKLREKGLRAANLKGSILSWVHAGQEVVDKEGPARRVHVYGPKWNLLPAGYEAVW